MTLCWRSRMGDAGSAPRGLMRTVPQGLTVALQARSEVYSVRAARLA
jgi:hypothetical protein